MKVCDLVKHFYTMATRPDPDIDDDFSELYKEYTGPPVLTTNNVQDRVKTSKRSNAGSDDEEEPRDPNAVPTDFTSREAKVWEAKSKATERIWKKRKEEEMICKICGEPGHFTQVLLASLEIAFLVCCSCGIL
jgi:formylmethanofuran dehydrogenase subunit E